MAEPALRRMLLDLLRRKERQRLANRLIGFLLFAASLYLLLLLAIVLLRLPLLAFHLLFYTALGLFPLFVLRPQEASALRLLRRIDEHCQIQACLAAPSEEHRRFLEPRALAVLRRGPSSPALRFRVHPANRRLALTAGCLLLLLQLLSLASTGRLAPPLRPAALRTMQAVGAARRAAGPPRVFAPEREQADGRSQGEAVSPPSSPRAAPAGGRGQERAEEQAAGEAPAPQQLSTVEARPEGSAQGEPALGDGAAARVPVPPGDGGIGSALKEAAGAGFESEGLPGQAPADTEEVGRAMVDSPLRDYSAAPAGPSIPSRGGSKLAADASAGPEGQRALFRELFTDFPDLVVDPGGFDPAIDALRRRYAELLDERY